MRLAAIRMTSTAARGGEAATGIVLPSSSSSSFQRRWILAQVSQHAGGGAGT